MVTVVEAGEFRWSVGGSETDDMFALPDHEANLLPVVRDLLDEGTVFVDVGAHAGHYAIQLADKASSVVAVEANPDTAALLRENVALNHLDSKITVVEAAAWDSNVGMNLFDPITRQVRAVCTRVEPTLNGAAGATRGIPLDDVLDDITGTGLVKMDVEGADLHALRGMSRMLSRERPVLFIERHDVYGCYTIEQMYELLTELNYTWQDGPESNGSTYLICHPISFEVAE